MKRFSLRPSEVRTRVFEMLVAPVREAYDEERRLRISRQFEAPLWQLLTQRPAHLVTANYAGRRQQYAACAGTGIWRVGTVCRITG